MDLRAAWEAKYAREPSPWRAGWEPPLDALGLPAGARVLEVGAAPGRTLRLAEARGWRVIGLDFAAPGLPPGGLLADAAHLPCRSGAFAGVLLVHVLGHLRAPGRARAAHEALRVLRPGGALLAVVLGSGDARAGSGREVEPGTRENAGILTHHFGEEEFARLLPGTTVVRERVVHRWGAREVLVALRPASGDFHGPKKP